MFKYVSHKKTNTVCFHLHVVPRIIKLRQKKVELWLPGARVNRELGVLFNAYRFSFGGRKTFGVV